MIILPILSSVFLLYFAEGEEQTQRHKAAKAAKSLRALRGLAALRLNPGLITFIPMKETGILNTPPECEIVTTRIFHFPRPLVYKAWTEPEHLKNWWGPKGFTNSFHSFDLSVGGRWIFTMHGPDKGNYPNECTFVAIREPELLVWDRQSKPIFQVEARFEEVEENLTRVVFKQKFASVEECEKIRKYVLDKNEENMDRLENELTKMMAQK